MKYILIVLIFNFIFLNSVKTQACFGNSHSNNLKDSWLSCEKTINPNPSLPNSYWLLYDLGYIYRINATRFWNFNVKDNTRKGMKNIRIDYSIDGENWSEAVSFQLSQASGRNDYEGEEGPNLGGIQARYILLSSIDNWGTVDCAGLSEVLFEVDQVTPSENLTLQSSVIRIFPNPSRSILRIDTTLDANLQEIFIYDTLGHEVVRMPFSTAVDIAHLKDGLYILKLLNDEQKLTTVNFIKIGN